MNKPLKLERILPTEQSESEYWNQKRAELGRKPTLAPITKIRPGLPTGCGCRIDEVAYGSHYTINHGIKCDMGTLRTERVECSRAGQAVAGIMDEDSVEYTGVMVFNGTWPHEE